MKRSGALTMKFVSHCRAFSAPEASGSSSSCLTSDSACALSSAEETVALLREARSGDEDDQEGRQQGAHRKETSSWGRVRMPENPLPVHGGGRNPALASSAGRPRPGARRGGRRGATDPRRQSPRSQRSIRPYPGSAGRPRARKSPRTERPTVRIAGTPTNAQGTPPDEATITRKPARRPHATSPAVGAKRRLDSKRPWTKTAARATEATPNADDSGRERQDERGERGIHRPSAGRS